MNIKDKFGNVYTLRPGVILPGSVAFVKRGGNYLGVLPRLSKSIVAPISEWETVWGPLVKESVQLDIESYTLKGKVYIIPRGMRISAIIHRSTDLKDPNFYLSILAKAENGRLVPLLHEEWKVLETA